MILVEDAPGLDRIETIVNLPWKKKSKISKDISAAQEILDRDHYGLEKVKERIVEYLAVQQRVDRLKGPILCLVGPPGSFWIAFTCSFR